MGSSGSLGIVQAFIDQSRRVQSTVGLHTLMIDITREMGFDHFALVHHVDLRPTGARAGHDITSEFVTLSDYPASWIEEYVQDEIVKNDPVLLASQRTNVGFAWSKVGQLISLKPAHRLVTERTRKAGLADGFTVPANIPGELNGSCNFAVRSGKDAPEENFAMAQLVGSFAFEAARTLVARLQSIPDEAPVQLTRRQLECLVLVAKGKSDWEIGTILGLSEATVTTYLKHVRERYDVPTRIQAVLRAVYEGAVPFTELF